MFQSSPRGAETELSLKVEKLERPPGLGFEAELCALDIKKLPFGHEKTVLISNPNDASRTVCLASPGGFLAEDCIRLTDEAMQNLKVQVGGSVFVKACLDIEYGSFVTLTVESAGNQANEEIVRKGYFKERKIPQMIGNRFSFEHQGKTIQLDVVDCHPEPYCLVGPVTKIKMVEQNRASENKKPIVVEYDAFGNGYQDDEEFSYYSEYDERQDEILEDVIQPSQSKGANAYGQESSFLDSSIDSVNGYVPVPRHHREVEPVVLNPRFNDPNLSFDYSFIKPKDAYKVGKRHSFPQIDLISGTVKFISFFSR